MSVATPSLLIVTESFEVGGLETYIAGQVRVMTSEGWGVHLACGSKPAAEFLPPGLSTVHPGLPLGPAATVTDLIAAVETLRAVIRDKSVTHVHAHPFTSIFPAMLAAALEEVPFIITLHGPTSLSSGYGPFNDYLLASLALPAANAVLAVSNEVGELAAPYTGYGRLCIQHNSVDVEYFREAVSSAPTGAPWLAVSRLDAVKIHGIRKFINVAHELNLGQVDIVGDGPGRATLEELLRQDGVDHIARFLGARADVRSLMHSSAGVAGMGRVLLEGIACGKPICMVGYDGVKGLVDLDLFRRAAYANFSGRNLPDVSLADLVSQLERRTANVADLTDAVLHYHSEDALWAAFAKQISAFPYSEPPSVRAIYTVLQSEEAASTEPYLQSQDLLYRIGRVVHSTSYFSPTAVACYSFYASRMNAVRSSIEREQLDTGQRKLMAAMAEAENRSSKTVERLVDELRNYETERVKQSEALVEAINRLDMAFEGLDARLKQEPTSFQRVLAKARKWLVR